MGFDTQTGSRCLPKLFCGLVVKWWEDHRSPDCSSKLRLGNKVGVNVADFSLIYVKRFIRGLDFYQ